MKKETALKAKELIESASQYQMEIDYYESQFDNNKCGFPMSKKFLTQEQTNEACANHINFLKSKKKALEKQLENLK